ncbi:amino acid adenylation domain-containing protein [Gorillibacterium sp. sgz500922]|uniref:amino acid adenylation domain-containing protein n=1 Tax=Gorillibacterium sp. sgz500922 TaxID=3446694 RepID=UPI003F66B010
MQTEALMGNLLLTSGKYKEERDYWSRKLDGRLEITGFPADGPADAMRAGTARAAYPIPEEVADKLNQVSRHNQVGLYILLVTGVQYLLHRYVGTEEVVIGMPPPSSAELVQPNQPNQPIQEARHTMPIITTMRADWTYRELLTDVTRSVKEARKYGHFPLAILSELAGHRTDGEEAPSFKTVVSLDSLHGPAGISEEQADMRWTFKTREGSLDLEIAYNKACFSDGMIRGVFARLLRFFRQVLDNGDVGLRTVRLLAMEEERQLLHDFNDTAAAYPREKTIQDLFRQTAARCRSQTAIQCGGHRLTYGELDARSDQVAGYLRQRGVVPNQVVAVMVERSVELLIAILGVLKAGGAYLPLDPEYPRQRLEYMLEDSGAALLLTLDGLRERVDFAGEIMDLKAFDWLDASPAAPLAPVADSSHLAYLIYTSGSTGKPKGVMIAQQAVVNFIYGIAGRIPFTPGKTIAALTTVSFDIFVLETLLPLTLGLQIAMSTGEQNQDPALLWRMLAQHQVSMLQATPSRMKMLLNKEEGIRQLQGITELMLGGEAFTPGLLDRLKRELPQTRIYNMYGPTETTVWSAMKDLTQSPGITLGTPILNTQIYILDPWHRLMPVGIPGELCIAGDGLSEGYWKNRELTSQRFVLNPYTGKLMYRTGDLARWLPNGELDCLGRMDDQVKIRGYRIELREIEQVLTGCEGVEEAVAIVRTDSEGNRSICAYFTSTVLVDIDQLRSQAARVLPDYMLPSFYIQLDAWPLTPNGKINKKALPDPAAHLYAAMPYVPPANAAEEQMAAIWRSVLDLDQVGVLDHFFSIGGHSLKALKLETELEKHHIPYQINDIYEYPTIREFVSRQKITGGHSIIRGEKQEMHETITASASLVTIERVDELVPYNDLFYRKCFYNSLFSMLAYYGQTILPIFASDIVAYTFDEKRLIFDVKSVNEKTIERVLADMGIVLEAKPSGEPIIDKLRASIRHNRPVVIWVDCFYEPLLSDTFHKQHIPHTWLVIGYDDAQEQFLIVEKDHLESLTYEKRWISYQDAVRCHDGYKELLKTLPAYDMAPYYELYATADKPQPHEDYAKLYIENMRAYREVVLGGMKVLTFAVDVMKTILLDEKLTRLYAAGVMNILTHIINSKIVEKHKAQRLLASYPEVEQWIEACIERWGKIRRPVAKYLFTDTYKALSMQKLTAELDEVCSVEAVYLDNVYALLDQLVPM